MNETLKTINLNSNVPTRQEFYSSYFQKFISDNRITMKTTKNYVTFLKHFPKYIKDMWKTYFTTHGLTMTDGLIQAVNYLKEQEEKGEVKLGAISILKN